MALRGGKVQGSVPLEALLVWIENAPVCQGHQSVSVTDLLKGLCDSVEDVLASKVRGGDEAMIEEGREDEAQGDFRRDDRRVDGDVVKTRVFAGEEEDDPLEDVLVRLKVSFS